MKELEEIGGGVHQLSVPYDILTDRYRLACKPTNQQADTTETATATTTTTTTAPNAIKQSAGEQGEGHPSSRFACGLLSTLLDYVEGAMSTAREDKPSRVFSRQQNL
ncbi:unnamed protein product, partial [Taenia asiatica]|uniref:Uncharacterized protein n=1 Tax=Taenia asiatica TaxID=60517 RepID=A0A0R3W0K5_TAEAS